MELKQGPSQRSHSSLVGIRGSSGISLQCSFNLTPPRSLTQLTFLLSQGRSVRWCVINDHPHSNDFLFSCIPSCSSLVSLSPIHTLQCLQTISELIKHLKKIISWLRLWCCKDNTHRSSWVMGPDSKNTSGTEATRQQSQQPDGRKNCSAVKPEMYVRLQGQLRQCWLGAVQNVLNSRPMPLDFPGPGEVCWNQFVSLQ